MMIYKNKTDEVNVKLYAHTQIFGYGIWGKCQIEHTLPVLGVQFSIRSINQETCFDAFCMGTNELFVSTEFPVNPKTIQ
jgi:hypothetical protein